MTGKTAPDRTPALLALMARLRDPTTGCPWDREQTFSTIAPYTIEEAYEVADAIARGDMAGLKDELGDLLFQVVFHSRMAEELGKFSYDDVVGAVLDKMIRRHPHVFGDTQVNSADAQTRAWEETKAAERAAKGGAADSHSLLADVPIALPALTRAGKLQKRAARVGFDWVERKKILEKLKEELSEFEQAIESKTDHARLEDEFGDILFVLANLARHFAIDPEAALRQTNEKFVRRFQFIEQALENKGILIESAGLNLMDELWNEAKSAEREKTG